MSVRPVRPAVRALLEEALAAAPDDAALRPRLLARLAIELYYEPPVELRERLSAEALAAGRRAGGPALLEALGARHVALWSPAHTEERLAIADELVATARAADDREAELQGINWRVADLFELGDREALLEAIADHERLAGELRLLSFAWYVPMWRATLALLRGRHHEARRLSEQGARIGRLAHDDNAELLFGVQRRSITHVRRRPVRRGRQRRDRAQHRALARPLRLAGGARRVGHRAGRSRPGAARARGGGRRAGGGAPRRQLALRGPLARRGGRPARRRGGGGRGLPAPARPTGTAS